MSARFRGTRAGHVGPRAEQTYQARFANRKLALEQIEQRLLLAADGVISGIKYTDITGNGFSPDDTPLGGVTIELFRDTGNGTLDGADPLVDMAVTNGAGEYEFIDLEAGTYFIREVVPTGYVRTAGPEYYTTTISGLGPSPTPTDVLVDSFAGPDPATSYLISFLNPDPTLIQQPGVNVPGGERDVLIDVLGVPGPVSAAGFVGAGTVNFASTSPGSSLTLQYDGQDVDPIGPPAALINSMGLSLDLTGGGANDSFRLDFLRVDSGAGASLQLDIRLTGPGGATALFSSLVPEDVNPSTFYAPFASFALGMGFSFTDVTSIEVEFNQPGDVDVDFELEQISATQQDNPGGFNWGNFQLADIGGTKFRDLTGDGFSPDDVPLAGITIELFRDGGDGVYGNDDVLIGTRVTDASGNYLFEDLGPGRYFVRENLGPLASVYVQTGGPPFYTIDVTSGSENLGNDFANAVLVSSLSGYVYVDVNDNGIFEPTESPIPGVTITLTGVDMFGDMVNQVTVTNGAGFYLFDQLNPGTYNIRETQPAGYIDGKDTIGTLGGEVSNDFFFNIDVPADAAGLMYNFGERGVWPNKSDIFSNNLFEELPVPFLDSIGVFDTGSGMFYLRDENNSGPANAVFQYGGANWIPIAGDWDGDGTVTIGVFDPVNAMFYLRNSNGSGTPDIVPFQYGAPGWIPIVGDWNGDKQDSIGVYDPATSTFYLSNSNSAGTPDIVPFTYGAPGWSPVVGDWNADGVDTVGVFDPLTASFYLTDTNAASVPVVPVFSYGGANWKPIIGDWDSSGHDTIGVYDPSASRFFLRNSNSAGTPDLPVFTYGAPGWTPLVGDWSGAAVHPMTLEGAAGSGQGVSTLTAIEIGPVLHEAVARWAAAGVNPTGLAQLSGLSIRVGDLPGSMLSMTDGQTIFLDSNAAGRGWWSDTTPSDDVEFVMGSNGSLRAIDTAVNGRVDLLTVLVHEMGHALGAADISASANPGAIMGSSLPVETRRLPTSSDVDQLFSHWGA